MFIYHWIIDPDQDTTKIRIFGISKDEEGKQENICLHVNNFTPYCYIQLPDDKEDTILALQEELQDHVLYTELTHKQHLYNSLNDGKDLAPFLFCQCRSKKKIHEIAFLLKRGVFVRGRGNLKFKVHEIQASPVLQMASLRDIPTAGWVDFSGAVEVEEDNMITSCDREFIVKWKNLKKVERLEQVTPKTLAFDIEVNSDFMNQMPMDRPGDAVFQISCVLTGCDIEDRHKILLSLKAKDMDLRKAELLDGVDVRLFDTEEDLLFGFIELVDRERPNVITGFNILGFDIEYIMKRCIRFCLTEELKLMGFNKATPAQIEKVKWSSSAYKNQEFKFFNWEGILLLDLLPLVKRDYKLDTYTLKNVAATFLKNDTKDPVTYKDIFLSYKTREKMDIVGKYCVQDSNICVELVKFFHSWIALSEMAKVCNVSMFTLYTQGQQIKTFSQVYKHCLKENIVVDSDAYETKANDRYTGAYVFEPVPGLYHRVVPLDFCLTGDTMITCANGVAKRLDEMKAGDMVVSWSKKEQGFVTRPVNHGLQTKGVKDTVKVILKDGTSITATPDHRFMLDDGSYCQAQDLKGKLVKQGPKGVLSERDEDEEGFELATNDFVFTMSGANREVTMAFCRVFGYVMADGTIYENKGRFMSEVYFGTVHDANAFSQDINTILKAITSKSPGSQPRVRTGSKGTFVSLCVPSDIVKMFVSLGAMVGKRAGQDMRLPDFLDDRCPKALVREFLGGLFGGDGTAPHATTSGRLGNISFKWHTGSAHIDAMVGVFHQLSGLIKKASGLDTDVQGPHKDSLKSTFSTGDGMYMSLGFDCEAPIAFEKTIGFRFCANKANRLRIAASYLQMKHNIRDQNTWVFDRATELLEQGLTSKNAINQATKELPEPRLGYIMDLGLFRSMINDRNHGRTRKIRLDPKKVSSFAEFTQETRSDEWFSVGKHTKKVYSVKTLDTVSPSSVMEVLDVVPNGFQLVFDIEVDDTHNFLVCGSVGHNCALYPSIIISQNICYSTLADDSVPDDQCNIFDWEDHVGCEHDPKMIEIAKITEQIEDIDKVIKKLMAKRDECRGKAGKEAKEHFQDLINQERKKQKPLREERQNLKKSKPTDREDDEGNKVTGIICAKRFYRFLKSEVKKGVIPTIIQNLLDSRKRVRAQMKKVSKDVALVYDKEQLAYKVSANSMYGAMGVRRGYLPFMPGAMCVTYFGRKSIEKTAHLIVNKWGGQLVYGDEQKGMSSQ